jgi:hypothetical protein
MDILRKSYENGLQDTPSDLALLMSSYVDEIMNGNLVSLYAICELNGTRHDAIGYGLHSALTDSVFGRTILGTLGCEHLREYNVITALSWMEEWDDPPATIRTAPSIVLSATSSIASLMYITTRGIANVPCGFPTRKDVIHLVLHSSEDHMEHMHGKNAGAFVANAVFSLQHMIDMHEAIRFESKDLREAEAKGASLATAVKDCICLFRDSPRMLAIPNDEALEALFGARDTNGYRHAMSISERIPPEEEVAFILGEPAPEKTEGMDGEIAKLLSAMRESIETEENVCLVKSFETERGIMSASIRFLAPGSSSAMQLMDDHPEYFDGESILCNSCFTKTSAELIPSMVALSCREAHKIPGLFEVSAGNAGVSVSEGDYAEHMETDRAVWDIEDSTPAAQSFFLPNMVFFPQGCPPEDDYGTEIAPCRDYDEMALMVMTFLMTNPPMDAGRGTKFKVSLFECDSYYPVRNAAPVLTVDGSPAAAAVTARTMFGDAAPSATIFCINDHVYDEFIG